MKKNASENIPSFQFYPNDWLSDVNLRMCSVASKGLWIDLICLMHRTKRVGYLVQKVDQKWINLDAKMIQKLTGIGHKKVSNLIQELIKNEVLRIDEEGLMYSKRIVKDEALRATRRVAGKKGGNPYLVNQNPNQNGKQKTTPSSSPSPSSSLKSKKKNTKKKVELNAQQQECFNQFWKIWPNKKSKGDAEKAWATIEPDSKLLAKILAKTKEGENSLEWLADGNGKRWIPKPATWLNAKGWEDEYMPVAKKTNRHNQGKNPWESPWEPPQEQEKATGDPEANKVWDKAKAVIKPQINQESFETWFAPTIGLYITDNVLEIGMPNKLWVNWLYDNYSDIISEALGDWKFRFMVVTL